MNLVTFLRGKKLPFALNPKRSLHPLDLIHCDLWGLALVESNGYLYYAVFIDDRSHFTWFYPLCNKNGFYAVLKNFIRLVQTQLSCKIKVFQSDGGGGFFNHTVRGIFEEHDIFHQLSCPHTPQQNGRAERKHRHIVEVVLAMLFHVHVPTSYWVDSFSFATYIINRLLTKVLNNHSQSCSSHIYLPMTIFAPLVAKSTRIFVTIQPTSFPHGVYLESTLDIILNIRDTNVLIQLHHTFTSLGMHVLMKLLFHLLLQTCLKIFQT